MPWLKPALLGCVAAAIIGATAQAQQPVKIRASFVAPVANWASILAEKEDNIEKLENYILGQGYGK